MDVTPMVLTATAYNVQSCLEVKMVPATKHMLFNSRARRHQRLLRLRETGRDRRDRRTLHARGHPMNDTSAATGYDRETQSSTGHARRRRDFGFLP